MDWNFDGIGRGDVMGDEKPIVVGVDGSQAAQRALRWALDEASVRGCAVQAVRVWNYEPMSDWVPMSMRELETQSAAALDESVRAVVVDRTGGPCVEQINVEGDAASALARTARDAAMLVVASHGGERLCQVVLGSVSAACVRHSTVPVVVLPPGLDREQASDVEEVRE
jgi:nucleotide-binding universal stress UspA family protein